MPDFWPHTCPVPGDGATVPQLLTSARVFYRVRGHDGAWMAPHACQRLRAYDEDRQGCQETHWLLLDAWVGCDCHRWRITT